MGVGGGQSMQNPQLAVVTTVWGMSSTSQSGPHSAYPGGGGGSAGVGATTGNHMGQGNMTGGAGPPPNYMKGSYGQQQHGSSNMGSYPQR